MNAGWIAGAVAAAAGIGALLGIGRFVQLRQALAGDMIVRISYAGSCFGAANGNKRANALRGSGMLALTSASIRFRRYFGRGALDIPLASLTGVDETHAFKDMVSLSRLLVVTYRETNGSLAAAAFTNVDVEAWMEAIRLQRRSNFI